MNFAQVYNQVKTNLNRTSYAGIDALAKEFVNEAKRGILWSFPHAANEKTYTATLTPGTFAYQWPPEFLDLLEAHIREDDGEEWEPLDELSQQEIDRIYRSPDDASLRGRPERIANFGDAMRVYPVPDKAYQVRVRCQVGIADMVADLDTNVLTEEYPWLLIAHATALGFLFFEEGDLANAWAQWYSVLSQQALRSERSRRLPNRLQIRPRSGLKGQLLDRASARMGWIG